MTAYAKGATFERSVSAHLSLDGYEVIRSAGSKTKVDLVAFKPGDILFVQCKLNGKAGPEERGALVDLAAYIGALPLVAYKLPGSSEIFYRRLTGTGPRDYVPWTSDEVYAGGSELDACMSRHPAGKRRGGAA